VTQSMKKQFINTLKKDQQLENEQFVLSKLKRNITRSGDEYLRVEFSDRTGAVVGNVWGDKVANCEESALIEGTIVQVYAKVEEFKGSLQLNIWSIGKVDEYDIADFVEKSERDLDQMWAEFKAHISSIEDKDILDLVKSIFSDEAIREKFRTHPAAEMVHHAFQGGLLEHTLEMLDLAEPMYKYYPEANVSFVKAGIIFHDIGKLFEIENNLTHFERTIPGNLLGHLIQGYEFVVESAPKDFPQDKLMHLKHIILAHNGSLEFGSPVMPMTIEAVIVSEVDMTSSKTRQYKKILKQHQDTDANFSNRDFFLGTKVYVKNSE
jgi:3'-5' exoribonuclease